MKIKIKKKLLKEGKRYDEMSKEELKHIIATTTQRSVPYYAMEQYIRKGFLWNEETQDFDFPKDHTGTFQTYSENFKIEPGTAQITALKPEYEREAQALTMINSGLPHPDSDTPSFDRVSPMRENFNQVWKNFLLTEAWAGGKGFGSLMKPVMFPDIGQPGDPLRHVEAGGQLKGWDKYGQLVAEAYLAAPDETPEGLAAFNALIPHIDNNFKRIVGRDTEVNFVPEDPYSSAEEMLDDYKKNKKLDITTQFNQGGFYGPDRNLKFRAVHDYFAHMKAGKKGKFKLPRFSWEGELRAYNEHMLLVGQQAKLLPALFTEIIGQAAVFGYSGAFPDQKIIAMPGFDYVNIGGVAGYQIIDGDLVKV